MKRIKLFEAFNGANKIEEANFILLCWAIELFIKENDLKVRMFNPKRTVTQMAISKVDGSFKVFDYFRYCYYSPEDSRLYIFCFSNLYQYFNMKGIKRCEATVRKAAMYVIKKMYEDEKNKTI